MTGSLLPAPGSGARAGSEVRQESQHAGDNVAYRQTVLALRLLEPGNPQPLDVQLRGRSLSGTLRDGDWVEVAGPPDATGRWDLSKVQNLTTGAAVVMGGRRNNVATVVTLVTVAITVLFVVLFVVLIGIGIAVANSET